MEKISLPKGTRDFGPEQMAKRQFIIDSIRNVFKRYGFQPLETPAMENLSTLTGKYGEEGDKLLFRVLDSGDFFANVRTTILGPVETAKIRNYLTDLFDNINQALGINKKKSIEEYVTLISSFLTDSTFSQRVQIGGEQFDVFKTFFYSNSARVASRVEEWFSSINKDLQGGELFANHLQVRNLIVNELILDIKDFISDKLNSKELTRLISEKGLRYDLTVPFARYVVMNRHEIVYPFKRYQIQPVWRADRPQKGRYREFYQCDADVVGTDALVCEAEIILMIKDSFKSLGILDYTIKINHRGILTGLAEIIGAGSNENSLFVAIDKLDKIGEEKVKEELVTRGFDANSLPSLFEVLNFKGNTAQKIEMLTRKFSNSEKGKKGLADFNEVLALLKQFGADDSHVEFDIALARGLSYYTGCIFEVKINNVGIGSVSGGGRYDNLTAVFDAKEKSSGVGFSFGIDRIYDAMEELKIFPPETTAASTVLIAHLDQESYRYGLKTVQAFRELGIASEIYPDQVKIKKQMEYADRKKIPFVVVIGAEEIQTEQLTLKKMDTGNQLKLSFEEIATAIQLHNKV